MLIKHVLYLVNVFVRAFERTIGWVVGVMDSLSVICGRRIVVDLVLELLEWIDQLLEVGKRYLERVSKTLRYRLYFEAVTRPMQTRYRELKRNRL
ncbi:MAG: hypothetical protein JSV89_07505 [Spirochaetaceae bacterium]|nr:MAG: hypothetical protein JSV89_07505 [Spirochaetaceae bacterium]